MHYKRIELKVTNQGIHERKIFQGVKIFNRSKLSKRSEKHSDAEALPDTEAKHRLLSANRCQL